MAVQNIRYLIQTTGNDPIYLYKDSSKYSAHNTIINPNYMLVATKISEDGNWYYLPAKDMWIKSSKISIISTRAEDSAKISEKLSYKLADPEGYSNTYRQTETSDDTSKVITTNDIEKNKTTTAIDTETNKIVSATDTEPTKTTNNEENVTNPTWSQPLATEETDTNWSKIPDLKTTGPKDVTGGGSGILAGALDPGSVSANTALSNQYRSFSTIDFNGVLGIPYQFMASVDRRLAGSNSIAGSELGRKYADKILTRNNLVYLTPCVQDFMSGFSAGERGMVASGLEGGASSVGEGLSKYGRYYTTKVAYQGYMEYVNSMCKGLATYMGIGNSVVTIGGRRSKLRNVDWRNAVNSNLQSFANIKTTVVVYADGLYSASDDFSNDTQESQLASTVNGVSDTAKELNFITKGAVLNKADMVTDALNSIGNGVSGLGGGGVLTAIAKNTKTLLSGGKLSFPELWGDSSHDTSYNINFKFRTPDNDPVSIFMNIIVPFAHLVCLTAPHDYTSGAETNESNGYREPFLVRATFKGLFSVDYGMITSMSCDRGSEGTWTLDGLPTQMDVSITIKDLYKTFYISKAWGSSDGEYGNAERFVGNDGLTDYLMCLSGVNLAMPVWSKKAEAYAAFVSSNINPFTNLTRMGTRFQNDLARVLDNVFR